MQAQSVLAVALAALAAPVANASDDFPWIADFDEAAALAKEQGKDLLVDFTGSDWCGWCIRLDEEVFAHDEFLTAATEDYVLVALDYPRGDEAKARVPDPERNAELQEKYAITGFPTILLMTAEGDAYGRTGYQPGGPVAYIEHLDELRAQGREAVLKAKKTVSAFDAADDAGKLEMLGGILVTLETLPTGSPVGALLASPARHALRLDPENAKGLKLRAVKAMLAAGAADQEVIDAAIAMDPENANGLLEQAAVASLQNVNSEEAVRAFCDLFAKLLDAPNAISDDESKQMMAVNATLWADRFLEDPATTARFAKVALETDLSDNEELHEKMMELAEG